MAELEETKRTKMKFVGKPNGILMKGAPRNYIHGNIYDVPWGYAKDKFWEPLETRPVLKVPPLEEGKDAIFNIEAFLPPEEPVAITADISAFDEPPVEDETAEFIRRETESMGDGVLGVDGIIPKRRKSKVVQP